MGKSTTVLVTFMLVIAGCSAGVMYLISNLDYESNYGITYVLDGGTNHPENPTSYSYGDNIELLPATKADHFFVGWYDEYNNKVLRIDPTMNRNITLYAQWEINLVGRTFSFDISGSTYWANMFFEPVVDGTIAGTYEYSYLEYNTDQKYLVNYTMDYTITDPDTGVITPYTMEDEYWTGERNSDLPWVSMGKETVTYKDHEYQADVIGYSVALEGNPFVIDKEGKQWILDGWIPWKMTDTVLMSTEQDNYHRYHYLSMEYLLTDISSVDPGLEFTLKVFGDVGIEASGSGTYDAFSPVKVTATETDGTFVGWYTEGGKLISSSKEYMIPSVTGNQSIYAVNNVKRDLCTIAGDDALVTKNYGMSDGDWRLVNEASGDLVYTSSGWKFEYTFDEPGVYRLTCYGMVDDVPVGHFMTIFADGPVTKTFEWKDRSNSTQSLSIDIVYSDYLEYSESDVVRCSQAYERGGVIYYSEDIKFVTYEDKYIVALADAFEEKYASQGVAVLLDHVLRFTQYVPYQLDSEYMGQEEYWKFPVETLFEGGGDCEDTAFLFCAVVKALGFDTAALMFEGHMAAAVTFDGQPSGPSVFVGANGSKYLYCETTAYGYDIGDCPRGYGPDNCLVVMVVPDKS